MCLSCDLAKVEQKQVSSKIGLNRDLNPGPLAPKARIIPLDHWALTTGPKIPFKYQKILRYRKQNPNNGTISTICISGKKNPKSHPGSHGRSLVFVSRNYVAMMDFVSKIRRLVHHTLENLGNLDNHLREKNPKKWIKTNQILDFVSRIC